MAGELLRYSGLITKARAMRGRLLSEEDLDRLLELTTVNEVIQYLHGTDGYREVYQRHEGTWHRGQAEAVIRDSLYHDFVKLYQFSDEKQRQAYHTFFFRYDFNVLKSQVLRLLRGDEGEEPKADVMSVFEDSFFGHHAGFSYEQARAAQSMQELAQCLVGTDYEPLGPRLLEQQDDFSCSMQLDIFFYTSVFHWAQRIKNKTTRSVILELYGTRIDWLNMMWIYRSKRFYEQTQEEILSMLIPCQYRLRKADILELVGAPGVTELNQALEKTPYFRGKDAFVHMEDEISYREVIDENYERVCRKYPVSMAPVLKYLHEKGLEIERVTNIIEGIRYQVPPKDIRDIVLYTKETNDMTRERSYHG